MKSKKRRTYIIGIDEVGRGALAGPVVVASARVPAGLRLPLRALGPLKDSKKLSVKQREAWFAWFRNHPDISYAIARVYPRNIEKLNISQAANLAAWRSHERIIKGNAAMHQVFLDGGLYLGRGAQPQNARTVIKGDEKIRAVAIASIIAKVTRDRAMVRLAKQYGGYGFEVHKGYGTAAHRRALRAHGPCPAHRRTFID